MTEPYDFILAFRAAQDAAVQDTKDAIVNGILGTATTGHTTTDTQNQAASVAQQASSAVSAAAAANATLAAQQGQTNANAGFGGIYRNITPSGADAAALSATDFASTGPTSGDLCIRGSNGYIGIKASNATATGYYAILNYTFSTDDQSVAVSLGDQGSQGSIYTTIYLHCDTSHTVGAYCRIHSGGAVIGSYTRSGGSYVYTPFSGGTYSGNINQGNRVEFRNVGTIWYVILNGNNQVLSVTDASVTFSAARRTPAISMDRQHSSGFFGWGSGDYDSFRVAAISMADYVQPTYVGSGAKIFRASTTQITPTYTLNAQTLLPASYFDSTDKATADITVDLVNGRLTVANAGWYTVTFRTAVTPGLPTGTFAVCPVLYKSVGGTPTAVEWGCPHEAGLASSTDAIRLPFNGMWSDFEIYLAATEFVQMGYVHLGAAGTLWKMQGAAGGLQTFMSITLLNRSIL